MKTLIAKGKGKAKEVHAQLEGAIDLTVACECEKREEQMDLPDILG